MQYRKISLKQIFQQKFKFCKHVEKKISDKLFRFSSYYSLTRLGPTSVTTKSLPYRGRENAVFQDTPWHCAAYNEYTKIVKMLADNKADSDVKDYAQVKVF